MATQRKADLDNLKRIRDSWKQELQLRRKAIEQAIRNEKSAFRRWIQAERDYRKATGERVTR